MSPRRAAALRHASSDTSLRDHLIASAARLIDSQGGGSLTVRDIAREANVADGVLYNHFADKDELLAHALATHIHTVMATLGELPRAGENTVEHNLRIYIERGLGVLTRIVPAFGTFLTQPAVMGHVRQLMQIEGGAGLPNLLADYLHAEQDLGRLARSADPDAAATLVIGACHEMTLPRMLLNPTAPLPDIAPEFVDNLVSTVMHGIAPRRITSQTDH
jgi:AcrR family transcriptional regulator